MCQPIVAISPSNTLNACTTLAPFFPFTHPPPSPAPSPLGRRLTAFARQQRCEDAGGNAIGKAITYNKTIKSLHFFDKTIGATTCKWLSEVLAAVEIEHFDFELQMLMPSEEMEAKQRPGSPTASMMLDGSWLSMLAEEREEQARIEAEEEELSKAEKASTSGVLPRSSTMKKGTAVGKVAGSPGTRMSPSRENSQAAMKTSPLRENSPSTMVRRGVNAEK